jgi:hypothetical protein
MHVLFALLLLVLSILCAAPLTSAQHESAHKPPPKPNYSQKGYEEIDIDLP